MVLRRTGSTKPSPIPCKPAWKPRTKVFDFAEQLSKGNQAESELPDIYQKLFNSTLTKHTDYAYDFSSDDGKKVELKTDFYDHSKTRNFFIERWSDFDKEKPGSLWQSVPKGVNQFIYWYKTSGKLYVFTVDLDKLIGIIEQLVEEKHIEMKFIQNKGYKGGGWCIPRNLLKDYYKEYDV
jgi:hypothetical protein